MSTDQVPHGEYSGYKHHGCRCTPCGQALREYQNTVTRLKAYGRWDRHGDADQVRAHIQTLRDLGWTYTQVAQVSEVALSVTMAIHQDLDRRVHVDTASRLLRVDPHGSRPAPGRLPAFGATNRVRCLAALGWSPSRVGREAGLSAELTTRLARGAQSEVAADTMGRLCEVYGRLSSVRPEGWRADRVRSESAAKGWSPPAGWDDHWLDLTEEELEAELGREAARMDLSELRRWYRAKLDGELSPMALVAADEFLVRRAEPDGADELGKAAA